MQFISEEYRRLNEQLHESNPEYGVSGQKYLNHVIEIAQAVGTQDILDYGCGKSTLAHNLPFIIKQYDPAIPKFAAEPQPADVVVCTDVLEHVEPELIDNVLQHLASLTKKAGFFTAATRPAKKTLSDGRNAHILVKSGNWWIQKIAGLFTILRFEQHPGCCVFYVEPLQQEANDNA